MAAAAVTLEHHASREPQATAMGSKGSGKGARAARTARALGPTATAKAGGRGGGEGGLPDGGAPHAGDEDWTPADEGAAADTGRKLGRSAAAPPEKNPCLSCPMRAPCPFAHLGMCGDPHDGKIFCQESLL